MNLLSKKKMSVAVWVVAPLLDTDYLIKKAVFVVDVDVDDDSV